MYFLIIVAIILGQPRATAIPFASHMECEVNREIIEDNMKREIDSFVLVCLPQSRLPI